MASTIPETWTQLLHEEQEKPYWRELRTFIDNERATQDIFPPAGMEMAALRLTPLADVKCVIIGQDPYHSPGKAHGLAFSVPAGEIPPPSLVNIFKELKEDLGIKPMAVRRQAGEVTPRGQWTEDHFNYRTFSTLDTSGVDMPNGDLRSWGQNGVLLLNTVLTVRKGTPASHSSAVADLKEGGWERFTDRVIEVVAAQDRPIVFILWGSHAQKKTRIIHSQPAQVVRHVILKSAHPSPLSARSGFFGSKPFSKVNIALRERGITPINWRLA